MDYNFEYIDLDTYKLTYTSKDKEKKEFTFKRTIEMAKELQGIVASSRLKMFKELSANGMTKNDLIVVRKNDDGTISYDETNYRQLEQQYLEIESSLTMDKIVNDCFGMGLVDLLIDLGVNPNSSKQEDIDQVALFSQKFGQIISGKENQNNPSKSDTE